MAEHPECTLREAVFEDARPATELLRRLGLRMPARPAAVDAHWHRLWRANPAMRGDGPRPGLGWVLEDDGRMVGFFGNIPLLYDYAGRPLIAADASQWGMEAAYRSQTPRLSRAYFSQPNVDLLLVTTAIKPTGRIFEDHGAQRLPQTDYDRILFWVIDAFGFLRAGLRKKGIGGALALPGAALAAPLLGGHIALGGRRPGSPGGGVDRLAVGDIGDDFDDLWRRKRNEAERLLACRDGAALRWHFGTPEMAERTTVLVRRDGNLRGYAVAIREQVPGIGLERLKIADMLIAGDDPEVMDALLAEAYQLGRQEGCHVLELVGLPGNLRDRALCHRPFGRRMATWPFYYKAMEPGLARSLSREESWYVTPYDGDTTLF